VSENTSIEWCDHTFNPWWGCTKIADGCTHCYAADIANRFGRAVWGTQGTRVMASDATWGEPLKWERKAAKDGVRRRVFCASMADVFEAWGGPIVDRFGHCAASRADYTQDMDMDELRRDLFALIDSTPHLDWLLLTKRPDNIRFGWPDDGRMRHNVWLGCSVATQKDADRDLPLLLNWRDLSPVLFASAEPLLGPVDLSPWLEQGRLSWIIVGGESGQQARPCDVTWITSIVRQCRDGGVPCFVKQLGTKPVGWAVAGDGHKTPAYWPANLRVREFPLPCVTAS